MTTSKSRRRSPGASALMGALALGLAMGGSAQAQTRSYNIPAEPLSQALRDYGRASGRQIIFTEDLVRGRSAPAVKGDYSADAALARLLAGAGLASELTPSGAVMIVRTPAGPQSDRAQAAPAQPTAVEEVVVTANKKAERVIDVPMSVVALGSVDLQKRDVTTLLDLSRQAPGLFLQDQGPGQRRITMRGVGNGLGTSSLVGLYLDEASVSSIPDADIDLRPYDLARIEVLRGPQGTLYGEGSMAGAIRFITNDPDLHAVGGEAMDRVSTTRGGAMSNDFTGALSVPLVDDRFAVRIAGEALNAGGWIDQPAQSRENINGQNLYDLRLIALARPSESLSVKLTGVLHRNFAGATNKVSDRSGDFVQVLGETATPSSRDDYDLLNATVTQRLGKVQVLSSTTYLETEKNLYDQGSATLIDAPPFPPLEIFGDRLRFAHVFSEELRASGVGERLSWVAGAYYRDATTSLATDIEAGFGSPFLFVTTESENQSKAVSVFGNAEYRFTGRLTLGGGLRYFHDRRMEFDGVGTEAGTFQTVSPRLYARYALTPDVNVYASVSKGFRSGGFNGVGLPAYGPETTWTYEAGAKGSALEGRLSGELAVYHTDYGNVQVLTVNPVTFDGGINNGGDAKINGVEASLTAYLTPRLQLGVSGSFNRSEFTSITPNSTQAVGDRLDFIPEYNGLVWAEYDFDLPRGASGYARVDYSVQGRSTYRNRTIGDFFLGQSDVIHMLNASLAVDLGKWRAEAFATNLLNDEGFLDPTSVETTATVSRPRTFGVALSRSF